MASAKIIELDETNTCRICDNALAKYSCPRCNIIYCSLTCYQAVGHQDCSEDFYKENVMAELKLDPNSPDSKAKMLEILQRTHENNKLPSSFTYEGSDQPDSDNDLDLDDIMLNGAFSQFVDVEDLEEDLDSDDDVDYVDIAQRLAGVNLDDPETVWGKFTDDERQDFVAFLKSEDVSKLIPSWQPWWLYRDDSKVTELNSMEDFKSKCPKVGDVKDFASVTAKVPANCVKYNLINVLCAYAFTVRYFNGEYLDFCNEAVATLATVSAALKKGQNFEEYDTAVKSVEQECIITEWICTDSENFALMRDDLEKILNGPNSQEKNFYVLCALTDFKNLLKECQKPKQHNTTGGGDRKSVV